MEGVEYVCFFSSMELKNLLNLMEISVHQQETVLETNETHFYNAWIQ